MGAWICKTCCLTPLRPKSKRKRDAIVNWRAPGAATSLRRRICFSLTCRPRISWLSIVARPSVARRDSGMNPNVVQKNKIMIPRSMTPGSSNCNLLCLPLLLVSAVMTCSCQLLRKRTYWWGVVAAVTTLASTSVIRAQDGSQTPIYLDPKRPTAERIDDLMGRMTLKEKVGQLNLPCVYVDQLGRDIPAKMEACKKFAAGTYTQEIGPACGFFTLANEILHEGARQQAEYFNELQRITLTQTRLKIPVMEDEEGTHGAMFPGGTVFPEGLAVGSSFDMDLVRQIYAAAAAEARAVGIHMLSTLVMEVNRDPRMGRNEEAYTEDPYLYMRIGETIVRAAQGSDISAPDKVIAVLTDFPTQSEPASGLERGAIEAVSY